MNFRKTLCLLIALAFIGLTLISAPPAHAEARQTVAQIIHSYFKDNNLPGLVVSVKKRNQHSLYVHGKANLELNSLMRSDSIFRIASVSKLFTTLGILVLKDRGLLSVNDKLSSYLPAFPYADQITIKNLLQHTSGIPDFSEIEGYDANRAKDWTPGELVTLTTDYINAKGSLDFATGTDAVYSNTNFVLLGLIIEQVSGKAYSEFIAENVVTPLGMRKTGVGSDTDLVPHRVSGYTVDNGKTVNATFVSVVAPFATGDFLSTPAEVVKFQKAFTPGVLLTRGTIDEMMEQTILNNGTPYVNPGTGGDSSFGYCWELIKMAGKTEWVYTKSGGISGFFAYFLYFKGADVAVAISTNAQGNFNLVQLGLSIGTALNAMR
ncbi:MAG TPA: serine hydrolase domain-containing protein [Syntrophorhabdaceae bacterium]|jgi:CubicO group peptidase (beta-lactamase class C family)